MFNIYLFTYIGHEHCMVSVSTLVNLAFNNTMKELNIPWQYGVCEYRQRAYVFGVNKICTSVQSACTNYRNV